MYMCQFVFYFKKKNKEVQKIYFGLVHHWTYRNLIMSFTLGFCRSRRCGTSTLFPDSIEEHFEKSCNKIAQPD